MYVWIDTNLYFFFNCIKGAMIDRIEHSVEQSANYTERAAEMTRKAAVYKKKIRRVRGAKKKKLSEKEKKKKSKKMKNVCLNFFFLRLLVFPRNKSAS